MPATFVTPARNRSASAVNTQADIGSRFRFRVIATFNEWGFGVEHEVAPLEHSRA